MNFAAGMFNQNDRKINGSVETQKIVVNREEAMGSGVFTDPIGWNRLFYEKPALIPKC